MALVSMASVKNKVDGSVKRKIHDFLHKLQEDDTAPGLHIEPMRNAVDRRVRTGRVDKFWRAVLYKLQTSNKEPHYIYFGTWPHDEAIEIATNTELDINTALGTPEFVRRVAATTPSPVHQPESTPVAAAPVQTHAPVVTEAVAAWENMLRKDGTEVDWLKRHVGLTAAHAEKVLAATTLSDLSQAIDELPEAQGLVVLGLANGETLQDLLDELDLSPVTDLDQTDPEAVDEVIDHAVRGSKAGFVFVGEDEEELKLALESMDINRWRVFLHPEQKRLTTGSWNGPYRISGGAGTGKTVVLVHRAKNLAEQHPQSRILLTTFTRVLADAMRHQLAQLNPEVPHENLGEPGVAVLGIDQTANRIVAEASEEEVLAATTEVLGDGNNSLKHRAHNVLGDLENAVNSFSPEVSESKLQPAFLHDEYVSVVLGNLITEERDYLRVSRAGRGTALNRKERRELWQVFSQFRHSNRLNNTATYPEIAAIASAILKNRKAQGQPLPFDYVLADEAQDFHAAHWLFLRSLVAEGPNDLFIAEDSHQRIYGQKVPLSRFGINIRGRSRRLRLNYRTTMENLAYAISILEGAEFTDIMDEAESTEEYRSVRSGPNPVLVQATSPAQENEVATQQIQVWLDQGVKPEAIGVLIRSEKRVKAVAAELRELGIKSSRSTRGAAPGDGEINIMTMHSAKGMEFQCVIVLGVGAEHVPAGWLSRGLPESEREDVLLRERSLLYVAATRARDELVVVWSGQLSEFFGEG